MSAVLSILYAVDGNVSLFSKFVFQTVGFIIGFIMGGITGYFGNWLWYRFGPYKKKPHFTMTTEGDNTSFSGLMTAQNQERILRSLRAVKTVSSKPESIQIKPLIKDDRTSTS